VAILAVHVYLNNTFVPKKIIKKILGSNDSLAIVKTAKSFTKKKMIQNYTLYTQTLALSSKHL